MRGWLIYEENNIPRNQTFIDFFLEAARQHQVELQLITTREIAFGVQGGACFLYPEKPVFAVVRCMRPDLSRHLERMGVRVFNSADVSAICNDKQKTHAFFVQHGLPCLDTAFVRPDCPCHPFDYPVVVKASGGCGGRQVYLCANEQEYLSKLALIAPDTAVVQPLCDTPGRDVRAYFLGGMLVQAMERYSDGDFRSNFGLHGQARPTCLTDKMQEIAAHAVALLKPALVGVDFVFHQGRAYLNEIEDAVGTRMLYQFTDIKIVDDYMDFILKSL
ncbi:MAG: ATP-grasp domain-containing protein [Clostridiales bacterium]|nr:ATP-grasp domain-containing protein [Clostridiales bacterium]